MYKRQDYYSSLPSEIKYHGGHKENDNPELLRAGELSMLLENGSVRYISAGKTEILRMIYFALRGRNWVTINPEIHDLVSEVKNDSFKVRYTAYFKSGEIDFIADFVIEGNPDNSITFSTDGIALSDFMKNRIGFCILHPVQENTGKPCKIIHTDGSLEETFFPKEISPHQPFFDIKSFIWTVAGRRCRIDFFGDIFETEDQRNWTDNSFKTYSTPLSIPYPAPVTKGERFSQKIILGTEEIKSGESLKTEPVRISLFPGENFKIPPVGVSSSSRRIKLSRSEKSTLKKIGFDHYRVDLHLFENSWRGVADNAIIESDGLGCSLEFALFFDDDYIDQAKEFLDWSVSKQPKTACLLLFHRSHPSTPNELAKNVIPLLRKFFHDVRIGTGTNANFIQLNRNMTSGRQADYACYSIHPQEHASDNKTLVENLEAQAYTVKSAKEFSGNKGIWISPVTIQRRFNANRVFYEVPYEGDHIPPQVDSRMMSLFGACWTAGSLKYLLESGVSGVTYFETAGERGIIQGDYSSRWPAKFISEPGMIFPIYHVFRFILKEKSFRTIKCCSSDPLKVESLVFSDGIIRNVILVNFTGEKQNVALKIFKGTYSYKQLNEITYHEAVSDSSWIDKINTFNPGSGEKLFLEPFSVTFIEGSANL